MNEEIRIAADILKKGGLVIFPTDTAFGIGCRLDDEEAVKRLYDVRKRPYSQPAPVLVSSIAMAGEYLSSPLPSDVKEKLINVFWPGGLTIILPCKTEKVPLLARGGSESIGLRLPAHKELVTLIKEVGVPLLGPSANFHGEQTPYSYDNLNKELIGKVDYVLKGACSIKESSTVVDCTRRPWIILRKGAVDLPPELI